MEREAAGAAYAALHEKQPFHDGTFKNWAEKRGPNHPYHYDDGVKIGVAESDLMPWDKFTTERAASPVAPASANDRGLNSGGDDTELHHDGASHE